MTYAILFGGDCLESMRNLPENSVDAVVTDPPYELVSITKRFGKQGSAPAKQGTDGAYARASRGFMNKLWDGTGISYNPETWYEVLRVLKPGGHMLCFGGSKSFHRIAVAIEDAGFELRDTLMWLYGCLDETTKAATLEGDKHYADIKVGDLVLCYDIEKSEYSYQPVQEVLVYDYDDTAYLLTGDKGTQFVTRNHRCITERGGVEGFEIAENLSQEHATLVPFLENLQELRSALSNFQNVVCDERPTQIIRAWEGGHKTAMVRVLPVRHMGKVWCLRVPTGAFVAVRDGVAFPTGNSGFPKSHDISKGIDKMLGAEREKVAPKSVIGHQRNIGNRRPYMDDPDHQTVSDIPASPEAAQWQGWGTALKPSFEPIILARKPLDGTVAANTLKWGVGGINIDACRVGAETRTYDIKGGENLNTISREGAGDAEDAKGCGAYGIGAKQVSIGTTTVTGRWPANTLHDGSDEVLEAFAAYGDNKGQSAPLKGTGRAKSQKTVFGEMGAPTDFGPHDGLGSAARFFYSAKASAAERVGTKHPTVKPQNLMAYLCKLITPPGGTVLDPFAGSGSTGIAAVREGFNVMLCEKEDEYCQDIQRRVPGIKVMRKKEVA
jgi:DNA modification methylase